MDESVRIMIIVLAAVIFGFGLPVLLYLSMKRDSGNSNGPLRNFIERSRKPWMSEEHDLEELSRRVNELKTKNDEKKDHDG